MFRKLPPGLVKPLAGLLLALGCVAAAAQAFPTRPVTVVVPFLAGNTSDVIARAIAEAAGKELGQPMVVESKPGAEGLIGIMDVRKSPADGYRILWAGGGSLLGTPATKRNPPFDPVADFMPIAGVVGFSYYLYVPANSPAKTMKEFIAYARANPGKVAWATANMQGRMAASDVVRKHNLDVTMVQYKGEAAAATDLVSDRIQAMFSATTLLPLVKEGKLRILGTTLPARNPQLPEVPTFTEQGVVGGEFGAGWLGFFAPVGTPKPVVERLNKALITAMESPEIQTRIRDLGLVYRPQGAPEPMGRMVSTERDTYRKLAAELNLITD